MAAPARRRRRATDRAGLYDGLITTAAMRAVFSDRATISAMLEVEAAMALAQARAKLLPLAAARAIARSIVSARLDPADIGKRARLAGNVVIPLVQDLTAHVARRQPRAARYVHWGATSQDIADTAMVLQARRGLDLLAADMARLDAALALLARRHRRTVMAGRTWLQQAPPITLGLKAAGWLSALRRQRERLAQLCPRVLVLQLGGAVGTLASMGGTGPRVAMLMARELKLGLADLPWHAHGDRFAELGASLALLVGTLGKMARDIALLMQSEAGEAFEPDANGRGGSSTMPHKRNPVASARVLTAALRAPGLAATLLAGMTQEHERGLSGWQAGWTIVPELFGLAAASLAAMTETIGGLEIDRVRMRANLELSRGLAMAEALGMALAAHLGKARAHELVQHACKAALREGKHLREVIGREPAVRRFLSRPELARLFDPRRYLGATDHFIDRALRSGRGRKR